MSNKLKYSVAVLLAITIGSTAIAQTPRGMKMLGMSDFEDLDINNDGTVSKEEIRERREIAVKSMDLNGDAKLRQSSARRALVNHIENMTKEERLIYAQRLKDFIDNKIK